MNELVRWDPFGAVAPFEDALFAIPSLLRPLAARLASTGPRMDVAQTESAYQLAVEIPGVPKDAIQVSVYENTVTINAELPAQEKDNESQWLVRERSFGKFSRSITLPEAVDDQASEARYVDGVLTLTLKKKSASQTKRLTIH
jgi:HSP20 family protein